MVWADSLSLTQTALTACRNLRASCLRLLSDQSAVAAIEFAYITPIMLTLGMYGVEIAYMTSTSMQLSQVALSVADNAARMQQTNNSAVSPTVPESDVDVVMAGGRYEGRFFDLENRGRIIISSLEMHPTNGKQYFHWQRCTGKLNVPSNYGDDKTKNGLGTTPLPKIGDSATPVTATSTVPVMVVEVFYDYSGLFGTMFVANTRMRQEAAFVVRDSRDLQAPTQPGLTGGNSKSPCTLT